MSRAAGVSPYRRCSVEVALWVPARLHSWISAFSAAILAPAVCVTPCSGSVAGHEARLWGDDLGLRGASRMVDTPVWEAVAMTLGRACCHAWWPRWCARRLAHVFVGTRQAPSALRQRCCTACYGAWIATKNFDMGLKPSMQTSA